MMNNYVIRKNSYIFYYLYGKNICVSFGLLNKMNKYDIIHDSSTYNYSSISPILNIENNKLIGIYKEV